VGLGVVPKVSWWGSEKWVWVVGNKWVVKVQGGGRKGDFVGVMTVLGVAK
jgi:hypothetical protein